MSTIVAQPSPIPMSVMERHPSPRSYAPLAARSPAMDEKISPNAGKKSPL